MVKVLRQLRAIEDLASTPTQRAAVREASGPLLAAAIDAGWSKTTLADAAGITPDTVRRRERNARTTRRGDSWGLAVESPPRPAADPDPLWLTPKRALAYTGVTRNRLYEWRVLGLLPRTRLNGSGHRWLYHRGDLDRLIALRGGGRIMAAGIPAALADPTLGAAQRLPAPAIGPNRLA